MIRKTLTALTLVTASFTATSTLADNHGNLGECYLEGFVDAVLEMSDVQLDQNGTELMRTVARGQLRAPAFAAARSTEEVFHDMGGSDEARSLVNLIAASQIGELPGASAAVESCHAQYL